jgi:hypothetical protein
MHFLAQSAHFRTPQDHLAAPGWFFRRHLISRSDNRVSDTRRCQTALRGRPMSRVTIDCHRQAATPQKPLRSADSATQNDKLDPRRVTVRTGNTRRNRDPRRAFHPGQTASAQLVFGSAGGPHRCAFVSVTVRCHRRPGEGANQKQRGPGHRRNEAMWGQAPENKPRSTRSPLLPQFG